VAKESAFPKPLPVQIKFWLFITKNDSKPTFVELIVLLLWFLFCVGVANLATRKGRSGILWFLGAIFLSPLVGIVLMCLPTNTENVEEALLKGGNNKKCPFCAEIIKVEAQTCRFCGKDLFDRNPTQGRTFSAASTPPPPPGSKTKVPQKMLKVAKDGEEFAESSIVEICELINTNDFSLDDHFLVEASNSWIPIRQHPQISS
jgi:hypothetical protein